MPDPRFTARHLQEHSQWLYGVSISEQEADDLHGQLVKISKVHGWSTHDICGTSCGIAIWLKSRLCEMGKFTCRLNPPEELRKPVLMHVFFFQIEETQLQLARLRTREPVSAAAPARSRLKRYMETKAVRPIDATALKVAPPPQPADGGDSAKDEWQRTKDKYHE